MALYAVIAQVWRIKLCEILAMACAPVGAAFTVITLATGSIWGKPMWGTWWDWDPRLTTELILLFLYLGVIRVKAAPIGAQAMARISHSLMRQTRAMAAYSAIRPKTAMLIHALGTWM